MKKAWIFQGGWEGHEPRQCVEKVAPVLETAGFDVRISDTLDVYADAEAMAALSLLVPCWTMGDMLPEQEKGLLEVASPGLVVGILVKARRPGGKQHRVARRGVGVDTGHGLGQGALVLAQGS